MHGNNNTHAVLLRDRKFLSETQRRPSPGLNYLCVRSGDYLKMESVPAFLPGAGTVHVTKHFENVNRAQFTAVLKMLIGKSVSEKSVCCA